MSGTSARYLVQFDCKHVLEFPAPAPKVGELLWCRLCRKDVMVLDAPAEWRIGCRSCRHARKFGMARTLAEIGAGKHRRRKGNETHVVALYNGVSLVRVFDGRMPTLDDVMPGQEGHIPF